MSLASWKKEFYKAPASKVSKRNALKHSIEKWTGLLSVNRRRHNVSLYNGGLYDNNSYGNNRLDIDVDTCALCHHHCNPPNKGDCKTCPVVLNTGKTCDRAYGSMSRNNRVQPMIDLLKRALVKKTNK